MKVYFRWSLLLALTVFTLCGTANIYSQTKIKIYDPALNAEEQINSALEKAKETKTNVLVQVGGNWCKWCHKLHKLSQSDKEIAAVLKDKYQVVYLNYSKENKNSEMLNRLEHPERFGFPVLVVLNPEGKRLHTQDSALLESDGGHDREKVLRFLNFWTYESSSPEQD